MHMTCSKHKEMVTRGGLSPFPGVICDWSGKFCVCQGKSQGTSETSGCGNHVGVKLKFCESKEKR